MNENIFNALKNTQELVPDEYDGSYELVRETARAYARVNEADLDFNDLDTLHLMSVATWKHGVEEKKQTILKSHLNDLDKQFLCGLIDRIKKNAEDGKYINAYVAGHATGNIGMFGAGFHTFGNRTNKKSVIGFIKLCTEILDLDDDSEIFKKAEIVLNKNFCGMNTPVASRILHCLKPLTFPILDSSDRYEYLGIKFIRIKDIDTYISNCKKIKLFRDQNFRFKNYFLFFQTIQTINSQKADELWQKFKNNSEHKNGIEKIKIINKNVKEEDDKMAENIPKNLILYGPPGTGKTYNAVVYAVAIIEKKPFSVVLTEAEKNYEAIFERYKKYEIVGMVSFTTFHQSYGYEEFIEGIKPKLNGKRELKKDLEVLPYSVIEKFTTNDESILSADISVKGIDYEIEDGVFKRFCKSALNKNRLKISNTMHAWNVYVSDEVNTNCLTENKIARIVLKDRASNKNDASELSLMREKSAQIFEEMGKIEKEDLILVVIDDHIIAIGYAVDAMEENDSINMTYNCSSETIHKCNYNEPVTELSCQIKWIIRDINIPVHHLIDEKDSVKLYTNDKITKCTDVEDCYELDISEQRQVLIIDEINRGNISKIFGELITLIEDTKRIGEPEEATAILPYSGEKFGVPNNIYILGTMNTADRSIALMDTALRRRFNFVEMLPDSNVLVNLNITSIEGIDLLIMLETINERIAYLFDREHTIGHAYFAPLKNDATLNRLAQIFLNSIIPLLQEYFYDDYSKIQLILGDNGKTDDEYKFISDESLRTKDVFKGNPDIDLPEKKYSVQTSAFYKTESYKQIY